MELVYYPDPRLRDRARPVPADIDAALREAVPAMFEIMYKSRGIGLAGPQVALGWRLVVANLSGDPKQKDQEQVFVNPEILEKSGEIREEEGCLSLPGMVAQIQRAERVVVRYRTLDGQPIERPAEGLEAKLFQHEIDHLDGILIVDKMTPADRKQWAGLLEELEDDFEASRKKAKRARA
ncbi:MAG TPA: peptide deformylase [Planctomycetota bacterium]|nr:peptide deformylase [Planctomycetota bacterium]